MVAALFALWFSDETAQEQLDREGTMHTTHACSAVCLHAIRLAAQALKNYDHQWPVIALSILRLCLPEVSANHPNHVTKSITSVYRISGQRLLSRWSGVG
jgi:hypothetical protein